MVRCPQCKLDLPEAQFYKNSRAKTGLASWCKTCMKLGKRRTHQVKYRRDKHLQATYGITLAQYDELLIAQNGGCKICESPTSTGAWSEVLQVDHDHITGKVRGLLCFECNSGIGKLKDSIPILEAAIRYLKENASA